MNPILSICIPTFNRAANLRLLLETLANELKEIQDKVNVIISNNASVDNTVSEVQHFINSFPTTCAIHQVKNLGPDENFAICVEKVQTRYFWMISDDDLPKKGVLLRIIKLLESEDTDLLYLNSEWVPKIANANDGEAINALIRKIYSRLDFTREVNVWVTFISGMIINLARLRELHPGINIRRFTGTNLIQLGWILPLLMTGNRFHIVQQRCVLATSGNTGGYKLFTVFGTNFPAILNLVCGNASCERKIIVKNLSWNYIPGLIWASRFEYPGKFTSENILKGLAPLKCSPAYWLIMVPLAVFPRFIAIYFLFISKVFSVQQQVKKYFYSATKYY